MKRFLFLTLLISLLFAGCGTKKMNTQTVGQLPMSTYESHLVDSILQFGLDNEALYTLLGNVKPMSSLVTFSFPVANDDSTKRVSGQILDPAVHRIYLDRIQLITRAMNKLNIPDLRFLVIPYLSAQDNKRMLQLNVIRISSLDSLLKAKESFYGQFGLTPGADPNVVVSFIECNESYERWRGYGYLFGYPDYAVDFYNHSELEKKTTGKFVPRDFFRIPTYARPDMGNFVYAYPKGHTLTAEVDSAIFYKAERILKEYRGIRNNYLNADSTLQSYKLLQDFYGLPQRRD